jgi:hypothetical protein
MCWLDILRLTTYNAATTFITKGGLLLLGGVLVLTELASNIAVVYLNLRKKRVKERSPQCRSFKKPCQVQRKYSYDK